MTNLSLEQLAERLTKLEREVSALKAPFGRFNPSEMRSPDQLAFAHLVDAEGSAWREQERRVELEAFDHESAP